MDHHALIAPFEPKREQKHCPDCDAIRFVIEVRHPGETL